MVIKYDLRSYNGNPLMNIEISVALYSLKIQCKEGASDFNVHWRTPIIMLLKLSLAIFEAMFSAFIFGLTNETDADFRVASFCISPI